MISIVQNNISFSKGDILTSNMLSLLHKIPKDLINAIFFNYPKGIISGFNVITDDDKNIILTNGLVKTSYGLFIMNNDVNISKEIQNLSHDKMYTLVLQKDATIYYKTEKSITQERFILKFIDNNNIISQDDIYICTIYNNQYKITIPTSLDELYKNFKNTLNLWNFEYSTVSGIAIHPDISRLISKKIISKSVKDYLDINLISVIENNGTITRNYLNFYCQTKIDTSLDMSNWNSKININTLIKALDTSLDIPSYNNNNNRTYSSREFTPDVNGF